MKKAKKNTQISQLDVVDVALTQLSNALAIANTTFLEQNSIDTGEDTPRSMREYAEAKRQKLIAECNYIKVLIAVCKDLTQNNNTTIDLAIKHADSLERINKG